MLMNGKSCLIPIVLQLQLLVSRRNTIGVAVATVSVNILTLSVTVATHSVNMLTLSVVVATVIVNMLTLCISVR